MPAKVISLTEYRVKKVAASTQAVKAPTTIKRSEIDMFRQLLADVKEGKVWFDETC